MTLFVERRRPAFSAELFVRVALAWAMISALLLVTNMSAMFAHRFPDPDDTLRLIEVRDLLAGQGWFDLTQHRVDAVHGGVPMHWSRLVDMPIAAVVILLRGLIGQGAAEMAALIVVPLLTFACALLLTGRIAWRLIGEEAAGFACLAMALSVPLVQQLRPMRIDHHGWQIVCLLVAVNGLMARSPRWGGWITGVALATWLAISIEGLPLTAAICGVAALRWLRDRHDAQWFVATMQGLALGSVALFLATRGLRAVGEHCDAISPAHLAGFGVAALAATGLSRLEPLPRGAFVLGLGLIAGAGIAVLLSLAPQCAGGAFTDLDPLVSRFWYEGVAEGLPVWKQLPGDALQNIVPPVIGLVACLRLAGRSGGWLRRWWQEYAIILCVALAIAVFVARAGAAAGALAAVPLGWQMREWLRAARTLRRPGKRALVLAGMALALLPTMPLTLLALAMPAQASIGARRIQLSGCDLPANVPLLRAMPKGEIFAPLDIGPQLLYETQHSVVATGHHRGHAGMRQVIEAFTGPTEQAHAIVSARGSDYLIVCPDLNEPARYADAAPHGFMTDLLAHRTPGWLEPVPTARGSNIMVWHIRR